MSRRRLLAAGLLGALVTALVAPLSASAAAPDVVLGTANVDGNAGEWDLSADFFAPLDAGGPIRANAYARYDCATETLFVLVLAVAGEDIKTNEPNDHYVWVDGGPKLVSDLSGDDGLAPDFRFIGQSGNTADGWEASTKLPPGEYDIRIFTKVVDDDTDGYDAIRRDTQIGMNCGDGQGQPRTIGYWKNWTSCDGKGKQAPVLDQTLATFAGGGTLIGDLFVNTCPEAIAILNKSSLSGSKMASDAAYNMAAQLLAAKLNVQANAVTCATATNAISQGQALLDSINFTGTGTYLKSNSANKTLANNLATILDNYNNGQVC